MYRLRYPLQHATADVLRSLWYRKGMTVLALCGVAVCIATVFANVQLSFSIYEHAQEQLDPVQLRQVVLTRSSEQGTRGFDEEAISELNAIPEVASATVLYEVQATMRRGKTGKSALAILESAGPSDPTFSQNRIVFGRALSNRSDDEIVLASSLANSLGISDTDEEVTIRLERTTDGKMQSHEQVLRVVGVVRGKDHAYVGPEVAKTLDLWADHVTKHIGEENHDAADEYESAIVYSERRYAADATKVAQRMGLTLIRNNSLSVPRFGEHCWFCVETPSAEDIAQFRLMPVHVKVQGKTRFVAMSDRDPRWERAPRNNHAEGLTDLFGDDIIGDAEHVQFTTPLDLAMTNVELGEYSKGAQWVTTSNPGTYEMLRTYFATLRDLPVVTLDCVFPHSLPANEELAILERLPREVRVVSVSGPDASPPVEASDELHEVTSGPDSRTSDRSDAIVGAVVDADSRGPQERKVADVAPPPTRRLRYVLSGDWVLLRDAIRPLLDVGATVSNMKFDAPIHLLVRFKLRDELEKQVSQCKDTKQFLVATVDGEDRRICVRRSDIPREIETSKYVSSGVCLVSDRDFLATVARRNLSDYLPVPRWQVSLHDQQTWRRLQHRCTLSPVSTAVVQEVDVYRAESTSGKIAKKQITALRMSRPTFLFARGNATVTATVGSVQLVVTGAATGDSDRFALEQRLGNKPNEMVLGRDQLACLGYTERAVVGAAVPLSFERTDAFGRDEQVSLAMRVVGVADTTAIPLATVQNVWSWQRRDVEFIDGEFQTPLDLETRWGAARAKLFVVSPNDVETLAKRFEYEGYLVTHKIQEMQQLEQLAASLRNLTLLLCGSSLLLCGIVVVGNAYMSYSIKKKEVDSLQSLGISRVDTVKFFAVEGLVVGVASLLLGFLVVVALGPFYGDVVCNAFQLSRNAVQIGMFANSGPRIATACAALALGYGLLGQVLAIWSALRNKVAQSEAILGAASFPVN